MASMNLPVSVPQPGKWSRVLAQEWRWRYRLRGTRYRIYIPEGIEYEPSIPAPARAVIPGDRLEVGALPHDVLYKLKGDLSGPDYAVIAQDKGNWERVTSVTREYADDLFRLILRTLDVSGWRIWLAHRAVRWFGKRAWDEVDDFSLPRSSDD